MSTQKRTIRQPPRWYPYGYPPMAVWRSPWAGYEAPFGYPLAYTMNQTPESELEMLESYREQLDDERKALGGEIEGVEDRIEELKKIIEEGTPTTASSRLRAMPFWVPGPYGPAPTPEQERRMLEQQADALGQHIEAIKKRLDELGGGESR